MNQKFIISNLEINVTKKDICSLLCDEGGGICDLSNKNISCKCKSEYTSFITNITNIKYCNYKKHSKTLSGLLELFFGFGIGHFCAERIINGYLKSFFCFLFYYCSCCFLSASIGREFISLEDQQISIKISTFIASFLIFFNLIWNIIDCLMFLTGSYYDGNNITLI